MSSVIQDAERLGAGIFVTARGIDMRLAEADLWRAFEEPVLIWAHGPDCNDASLEQLIALIQKIPDIQRFRLTSTAVTQRGIQRIRDFWPEIPIEGITS